MIVVSQEPPGRMAATSPLSPVPQDVLDGYLADCRARVLEEIRTLVPRASGPGGLLYELMLDYPMRKGKALRPALCVASCRAQGGHLEAVLPTAAVLELYHNAFLIHDDVEDGSERRRSEETLHRLHGVPIAVNVGDGILALTMEPLLDNIERIGLGRALRILRLVARMARESAEGQMMELDWVRRADWSQTDKSYVRMVYKKTTWYTFLAPLLSGAIAAGVEEARMRALARFATPLGIAFQIQDDVLNLVADEERYGKEIDGDLWEGKLTLVLLHALRSASEDDRDEARRILGTPRPAKTEAEVAFLRALVIRTGALDAALQVARARARRARRSFERLARELAPSVHRDFLAALVDFVVERDR
jgi:geranylgeranyl diphosphate synthase type II